MPQCPFTEQNQPCDKTACGDCPIRIEATARENEHIAENLSDYWKSLNSGAEGS